MTNTREEVAMREAYVKWIMSDANRFGTSSRAIFEGGYKAGGKYVAGLVEALKRIAESEYDYETGQHSDEIAEEALNNLPEEIRG